MAKINHTILEYQETLSTAGLPLDTRPPKAVLRRFVRLFRSVDDSRLDGMIEYPLVEILLIAFLAVLANASTWADIAHFAESKKRWLKKFIPLKHGIPSHDTFRRVFSLIDPLSLQQATVSFLMENMMAMRRSLSLPMDGYRLICVHGKEEKGTGRKYGTAEVVRNLQALHVYDATHSVCLFSQPIDSKTNEIPVAQDILKGMDLHGCIVTFDAMHTQVDTISIITRQKGEYVGGLRGNQAGLRSFVCFEKYTCDIVTGKENTEQRFYITSLSDVALAAQAIRGHWGVENNLHWHLDYSFSEDEQSTMDKTAFQNLSLINKLVLSLCKMAQPVMKGSIRSIRLRFSWELEDNLALLLNTFDDEAIQTCLESVMARSK